MAIVLNPFSRIDQWMEQFAQVLPGEDLWLWPDVPDPEAVEFVIGWVLGREPLNSFTNLRAILSLGAGAEQWQKPGSPDVPVVRLADPAMAKEMTAYALAWVVRHQRDFAQAERWQREGVWKQPPHRQSWEYSIGILGFGTIGGRIGRAFADLGYQVNAWSRSGGSTPGVTHFAGDDQLEAFLAASDAVINVLPNTAATRGLLTAQRFAQFKPDSLFVNIGRGTVVADEAELIVALDGGPLAAAVLDVTAPEPPVESSPFFGHPAVTLTAHIAGTTQIKSAAQLIAANIARIRAGEAPFPLVDRSRGY